MRIAPSLIVLCIASQAHADRGLSLELGYLRNRVAVTDQTALDGQAARFSIRLTVRRHFHWGVEAEEGRLEGTTALPNGAIARTQGSTQQLQESPLEGNTLGLKLFGGVHGNTGPVMFGADLAGGMRDTWVSSDQGPDVAGYKNAPLLEVRTRADLWLTRSMTLGAVATSDLRERRDISLGVVFAMHFNR